ncbi:hypothetical protein [Sporisorium scitamineum]|uniref:Uncharacterized protein n=1 Tax=Sporisorium scitamineum TaxID=49012 RepID=A0A0F7S017_9BASI|nr:hypothetical protein [Sporisorium scitamineum]
MGAESVVEVVVIRMTSNRTRLRVVGTLPPDHRKPNLE